uniref:Fibronectin type-III domain-containing protein n=1 Tax=Amphiprion ocellaris TaxID=80972 RepID=A0A3Q1BUH6_AMPOC
SNRGDSYHCFLLLRLWSINKSFLFSLISMDSVDMRHTLRWRPPQASCNTTVLYSVQYQGYFELLLRNGSWLDAAECQQIPGTHCDLSLDLGSDSDYNLQVRAQCGSQRSAWTRLSRAFNRRDTLMTVPEMSVTTSSDALQVTFNKLPPSAAVSVTVWKEGDEMQVIPSFFWFMSPPFLLLLSSLTLTSLHFLPAVSPPLFHFSFANFYFSLFPLSFSLFVIFTLLSPLVHSLYLIVFIYSQLVALIYFPCLFLSKLACRQ